MPASARNNQRSIKKGKPSKHKSQTTRRQTPPKSINRSAARYPSQPGVEGAPPRTARLTARGTPLEADKKERQLHSSLSPAKAGYHQHSTPAPERARLSTELQQLYAEGKFAEIIAQTEACLPKDPASNFIAEQERSDVEHDLLAFLAERMLEMNKQKQQEIKGFLGWLEGFVGAKVEDFTPKTKLQSYYEHDYEGFLAVLKKNKKSWPSILLAGSPRRHYAPSSRDRWANWGPCGSRSGRRMS